MPKIALSGKGGVGKTTWAALLAGAYAKRGDKVLAIDADPSPCLANALGLPVELAETITPIADMEELIYERTGAQPGTTGGYFRLNPKVDDIPDRFSASYKDIKLLQLGHVEKGGSGCICPESTLLKALVTHLLLARRDVVILDMYAGTEHLGRGTADSVDAFLIVVEPSARSLATAKQMEQLARDIHIEHLFVLANRVRNDADRQYIIANGPKLPLLGVLPEDPAVLEADRLGIPVYEHAPALLAEAERVIAELDKLSVA
jgi:CO dehydrogenase maturation factor